MDTKRNNENHLEVILAQLGDFGRYQTSILILVSLPLIFVSAMHLTFVFTAMNIQHRCEIPGCDSKVNPEFKPNWLKFAIPFDDNHEPKHCKKYLVVNESQNCSYEQFDIDLEQRCQTYVYASPEITIVHDFNLQCDENLWKLTIIGTLNNIAQFVGTLGLGYVADRYGRKQVLVWGTIFSTLSGIARAFTTSYSWFLIFEFLDGLFGCAAYATGFVLAIELVGPQRRVLLGSIICTYYTVGEVVVAILAWLTMSWRLLLLILYIPALTCLACHWILPESVRWLLSQERYEEAFRILRKAANTNGKEITEKSLEKLVVKRENPESSTYPMQEVLKSKSLLVRLVLCCICWITCTFLFYGLTLNSVNLSGNPYLDFSFTSAVEFPAYVTVYFLIDSFGRRYCQCGAFWLTSASCIAFMCFSPEYKWFQFIAYLLGKFGATVAFTTVYFFTSEMFPTALRQSLMGLCSTVGRIGSMVAPQTPLLEKLWKPMPIVIYAVLGILAGLVTLIFPETANVKLPDTVDEAVNLGRKKEDNSVLSSFNNLTFQES